MSVGLKEIFIKDKNGDESHLHFIDLAKGICILLVVTYHCDYGDFIYSNDRVNAFFFSFRMPLYYFISGIFISYRRGYRDFTLRKINRLIIPFLFFYFVSSIMSEFLHPGQVPSVYEFLLTEYRNNFWNTPIWFLPSLFATYMIYTLIHKFITKRAELILLISLLIGVIGYYCSSIGLNIPFFIDTSLTCFPFVAFGNILRQKAGLLDPRSSKISLGIVFMCVFAVLLLIQGKPYFYKNEYDCNVFSLYACGLLGSIGLVELAKTIQYIPIINYIGRYSIIVLGFHLFFITRPIFVRITTLPLSCIVMISILTAITGSIFAIIFCRKYLGYFVAQKDLIKI